MSQPTFRDAELLSAFLDSQLSGADSVRLETRLAVEPELRAVYDELRQARGLLARLPARRAPRNFTLSPGMAGIRPPAPAAFSIFRLASVFAVLLLFAGYAIDLAIPAAAGLGPAAAPLAYTSGAAGTAPSASFAPAATQGLAPDLIAPTATPFEAAASSAAASSEATFSKRAGAPVNRAPIEPGPNERAIALPVPPLWLFGLLALVVISAGSALVVRTRSENIWRRANALRPARLSTRSLLLLGLAVVAVLLLAGGIYWISAPSLAGPLH